VIRCRDDGDVVKALGFVALNSGYLEDELAELAKAVASFCPMHDKIQAFRLADRARHLRKSLTKLYVATPDYLYKDEAKWRVERVLRNVEQLADARNEVLHSPIFGGPRGQAIQKNSRRGDRPLSSGELYKLAEMLGNASGGVYGIRFPVGRLYDAWRAAQTASATAAARRGA
jgi:hypothetical protein